MMDTAQQILGMATIPIAAGILLFSMKAFLGDTDIHGGKESFEAPHTKAKSLMELI
jgi:hypothetical protein